MYNTWEFYYNYYNIENYNCYNKWKFVWLSIKKRGNEGEEESMCEFN